MFIIVGILGVLGLVYLMRYHNHKLIFDDEKIIVQNWRGETKEMNWTEINEIKFNYFMIYFKIKGSNKQILINQYLVGFTGFVKKMKEKIG